MQRKFRKAFTNVKEHGLVSYAKVVGMAGFDELNLVIIKETSPEDLPLREKFVQNLLKTFTNSPSQFRAFSLSFCRRFGKTKCWRVALKCLVLLHRLIQSLPHDSTIRDEIMWARSTGLLSLVSCYFRDLSSSCSEYYTLFIRSYARLLDEALESLSDGTNKVEERLDGFVDVQQTTSEKMDKVKKLLIVLPQLQSLIDRVIDCRPKGPSERSFLIRSAMKHIIRDSFVAYKILRGEMEIMLETLMRMPYRNGAAAFAIYRKASTQAIQLDEFYDWCKSLSLCGPYEYPLVDKIPIIQVQALEKFLNGLWKSGESSSSSDHSPFYSIDDDYENKEDKETEIVANVVEIEPLIKFDETEYADSWEELLEASINSTTKQFNQQNNLFVVTLCGPYEYPLVDKIPIIQVQALEKFLNGLWKSGESSSSSDHSLFYSIDEDYENKEVMETEIVANVMEIEPLIKFDETEYADSWEELLQASINSTTKQFNQQNNLFVVTNQL